MSAAPPTAMQDGGPSTQDGSSRNPDSTSHHTVTDVANEPDFDQQVSTYPSSALLVIYFHAPWAEPCKQMSTILSALASTYKTSDPPTIGFLSLDAEEVSDVSEKYDVTQVPYIVLQKDGKVVETISGSDAAKVRTAVEKHAGKSDANPGKLGLPPVQNVARPSGSSSASTGAPSTNGENGTKNLSSYAPSSSDPATAPEYSSGENNEATKDELNERLGDLVKAAPVMLFMKGTPSAPQCGFSRQCVSILRERGIRYGFFNILADDEVRQGLKEFSEWPTFPQIYVSGELIGGLDILKEEFENDPEFLADYVAKKERNGGGPAAPEMQATPA